MNDFTGFSFLMHNIKEEVDTSVNSEETNTTMLAKVMYPSRKIWEDLGFVFLYIPGVDDLYDAIMPEGWTFKMVEGPVCNIIDENGMHRGAMFCDDCIYMKLFNRYNVFEEISDDSLTKSIYFGNENEKLFLAGQVRFSDDLSYEENEEMCIKVNELWDVAMKFADENYPDWQNVTAYWDIKNNEKEKIYNN